MVKKKKKGEKYGLIVAIIIIAFAIVTLFLIGSYFSEKHSDSQYRVILPWSSNTAPLFSASEVEQTTTSFTPKVGDKNNGEEIIAVGREAVEMLIERLEEDKEYSEASSLRQDLVLGRIDDLDEYVVLKEIDGGISIWSGRCGVDTKVIRTIHIGDRGIKIGQEICTENTECGGVCSFREVWWGPHDGKTCECQNY